MLHKRLERERTKRNLTQDEVARKIGVARSTYANYENGNREPDLTTLTKIAAIYEMTVGQLIDGTSSTLSQDQAEFLKWVEENLEDAFFYDFHRSPDEQKEEMMETLRMVWELEKKRKAKREGREE